MTKVVKTERRIEREGNAAVERSGLAGNSSAGVNGSTVENGSSVENINPVENSSPAGNKLLKDKNSFVPNHSNPTLVGILAIPTIKSL